MSFLSKFFIFLIGLAVLATASAWIMGGESQKNSTRISINATPNSVFQYLVDDDKIRNWGSDLVSAGPYKDDDGENSAFETLERVVLKNGEESVWQESIMRYQRGEALSIQSRKGGLTKTFVFKLEENDLGGTDVLYRTIKSASGLEKFIFPFQEKESSTQLETELESLKKLVESEVEPGFEPETEAEDSQGSPVVVDSSSDNNTDPAMPVPDSIPDESDKPSVIDQVLGEAGAKEPDDKPKDGERNFEKLFGTGG